MLAKEFKRRVKIARQAKGEAPLPSFETGALAFKEKYLNWFEGSFKDQDPVLPHRLTLRN